MERKRIVAGNWKMNLSFEEGKNLTEEIVERNSSENCEVILIPSFIHLTGVQRIADGYSVKLGSQNNHHKESGAYTGEVSVSMLKSIGVHYGLVGHSERRKYFQEDDDLLLKKTKALLSQGIKAIYCCGEQAADRKEENHFSVIDKQLSKLWTLSEEDFQKIVIAYEPVWAIGTGVTATADQAQEMHAYIRGIIRENKGTEVADSISILYGGSCNPSNAKELFLQEDVDGGLIGGASLNADDFMSIVKSFD